MDNITAVLTEDEVWLFNPTLSIRCIKALPDIAAEMSVKGTDLVIQLMTGESWLLNTQTGSLNQFGNTDDLNHQQMPTQVTLTIK